MFSPSAREGWDRELGNPPEGPALLFVRILKGLKLVIEGRVETQRASLDEDAKKRVFDGLADISAAILYPTGLGAAGRRGSV